jgi:hypothetical protein
MYVRWMGTVVRITKRGRPRPHNRQLTPAGAARLCTALFETATGQRNFPHLPSDTLPLRPTRAVTDPRWPHHYTILISSTSPAAGAGRIRYPFSNNPINRQLLTPYIQPLRPRTARDTAAALPGAVPLRHTHHPLRRVLLSLSSTAGGRLLQGRSVLEVKVRDVILLDVPEE